MITETADWPCWKKKNLKEKIKEAFWTKVMALIFNFSAALCVSQRRDVSVVVKWFRQEDEDCCCFFKEPQQRRECFANWTLANRGIKAGTRRILKDGMIHDETLFSNTSARTGPRVGLHFRTFCFPHFICRFLRAHDNDALFHIHWNVPSDSSWKETCQKWSLVQKSEKEEASEATDEWWRSGHTESDWRKDEERD